MKEHKKNVITGCAVMALLIILALLAAVMLSGCAATQKQLAKNLEQKSIMGDGILTVNQITISDPASETFTPELKSIFISGKFLSLLKNATLLAYDRKSTASTFNASAVTSTESLVIQTQKPEELAKALQQLVEIKKQAPAEK